MLKIKSTGLLYYLIFLSLPVFAQYKVVGYYAEWFKEIIPAKMVKFGNLTHINHAFALLDENGRFSYPAGLLYPQLNTMAHDNNVKIVISIGGWGNAENFAMMAIDSIKRSQFIEDLALFIEDNDYDGVDFDWEYPENASERTALTNLVMETRAKFDSLNPEWVITMAVPTGNWYGQWQDFNSLRNYVDWFNAMCYDFHGSWSGHSGHNAPLYQPDNDADGSVETALDYLYSARGIPKNLLTVGIPFYGKQFNSTTLYSEFSNPVTDLFYSEIIPLIDTGWNYLWDDVSKVPYLKNDVGDKIITYDDTVSVRIKCEWIKEQAYSGAMIWALGQDLNGNEQQLLRTIGNSLLSHSVSAVVDNSNPIKDFILFQNYPNPFNPVTTISFYLKKTGHTKLKICNQLGQDISILLNKNLPPGSYNIKFEAGRIAGGIYYYELITNGCKEVRKMTLLK